MEYRVEIGRVKQDEPTIGGEYVVLIVCAECGKDLSRLSVEEKLTEGRAKNVFHPCPRCAQRTSEQAA